MASPSRPAGGNPLDPRWQRNQKARLFFAPRFATIYQDLAANGAGTSSGSLDVGQVHDLRSDGAATSTGALDATLASHEGFFGSKIAYRPFWRRQPPLPLLAETTIKTLEADGTAVSSGDLADLAIVSAVRTDFNARPSPRYYNRPYWRRQPLLAETPIKDLAGSGAALSVGSLDVALLIDLRADGAATSSGALDVGLPVGPSFFTEGRPNPQPFYRPYWRRQALLGNPVAPLDLAAAGTASSSGAAALNLLIDIAAAGTATSFGSLDLLSGAALPDGQGAFPTRRAYRPYWRRQPVLGSQQAVGLGADGLASSSGALALNVQVDLRATGAAASSGALEFVRPSGLIVSRIARRPWWRYQVPLAAGLGGNDIRESGAATSTGALALNLLVDLRADGASVSQGQAELGRPTPGLFTAKLFFPQPVFRRQNPLVAAVPSVLLSSAGATVASGTLALRVIRDIDADGIAQSAGALDVFLLGEEPPSESFPGRKPGPAFLHRIIWRRQVPLQSTIVGNFLQIAAAAGAITSGSAALSVTRNLAAAGAASSSGSLDVADVLPTPGFFTEARPNPVPLYRPYWRRQTALPFVQPPFAAGAASSSGSIDLVVVPGIDADGAAISSGALAALLVNQGGADGTTVSSGAGALILRIALAASGAANSRGGADFKLAPAGFFYARPGPRFFARPYWRRQPLLAHAARTTGLRDHRHSKRPPTSVVSQIAPTQTVTKESTSASTEVEAN